MHVFTYGTLQVEEVWRRVALRPFPTVAGEAQGFTAHRIRGVDYPGMTPRDGVATQGTVYLDVDDHTLSRLDRFEGDEYERWTIPVQCADGLSRECQAYVIAPGSPTVLTSESWSIDSFLASRGFERFLGRYAGFFR